MTEYIKTIVDCSTGEQQTVPMTEEEIASLLEAQERDRLMAEAEEAAIQEAQALQRFC
jgi:hypothetical protein